MPTAAVLWSDVEGLGRCVDRQLECVRSILAAADPALADGALGHLVRQTALEATTRWRVIDEATSGVDPETSAAMLRGLCSSLHAISVLTSRSVLTVPNELDVLQVLGDVVTDRFRALLLAVAAAAGEPVPPSGAFRLPVEHYLDRLAAALTQQLAAPVGTELRPISGADAVEAMRLAAMWAAIAGHVGEAGAWLAAWHGVAAPVTVPPGPR